LQDKIIEREVKMNNTCELCGQTIDMDFLDSGGTILVISAEKGKAELCRECEDRILTGRKGYKNNRKRG